MKKGFTLAELLGVIVIIGLLLLLIIPLIINGVKNKENDVENIQNNIIYEAVGEYMDSDKDKYPNIPGNIYCITIGQLKEAGKLVGSVKNIVEDEEYKDDYTITVTITKNGTRKYSVSEGKCTPYKSKNIEIVINPSNSKWSKEKDVTIYYPEECGAEYTCTYKKDNEEVKTVTNGNSVKLKFKENGTIEANMKGKSEIEKKTKIEKIDIEDPIIVQIDLVTPWTMNYKQQVNITLTDAHSGVGGYCIKKNEKKPDENDECFKTVRFPAYGGTGTVTEFLPEGKYYIFVKDRVGNIGGYNSNDPSNKKTTFEVKDDVPPTCTVTTAGQQGTNGWFIGNVTMKVNPKDDYSGVREWDLTLSPNPTYNNVTQLVQTADTLGTTYYGYVEDRAGNKNKCNLEIKKDATKPTCQTSKSHTGTTDGVTVSIACNDSSPSSGIASCPPTQTGVKAGSTYTVKDGAGNTNTCSVSITETHQNYRQMCGQYNSCRNSACGPATCTSGCCGYNPGACNQWCCEEAGTGVTKCGSTPPSCGSSDSHSGAAYCVSYSQGSPKSCTNSSCCGYKSCRTKGCGCASWNGGSWTTSNCSGYHSSACRITGTRILYS